MKWKHLIHLGPLMMLLALPSAHADTVVLRSGEKIVGKVIHYGEFVIVVSDPTHVRILDPVLIDLMIVSPEPPSGMDCFLDLPPPTEDASDPDPSRVHVYASAKAKARDLLDLGSRHGIPAETAARAREALKAMGPEAEDALLSAVTPEGEPEKFSLALACLEKAQPKGLEKRLVDTALRSDQETLCRLAAEELKRRLKKTPPEVLKCLTDPETGWKTTRAAADVVEVIRDKEGIHAVVEAIRTRGVRVTKGPRVPFIGRHTQEVKQARNRNGGDPSISPLCWVDEEVQFKEPEERILFHLVRVLQEISGREFKDLQEVEDWHAGEGGK